MFKVISTHADGTGGDVRDTGVYIEIRIDIVSIGDVFLVLEKVAQQDELSWSPRSTGGFVQGCFSVEKDQNQGMLSIETT